jgi:hypothetical protein
LRELDSGVQLTQNPRVLDLPKQPLVNFERFQLAAEFGDFALERFGARRSGSSEEQGNSTDQEGCRQARGHGRDLRAGMRPIQQSGPATQTKPCSKRDQGTWLDCKQQRVRNLHDNHAANQRQIGAASVHRTVSTNQ